MVHRSARIADLRGLHASQPAESGLDAPEAAGAESGFLQWTLLHTLIVPSLLG